VNDSKIVVLAGASGFIGRYFRTRLEQDGWQVRTIGRPGRTGRTGAGTGVDAGAPTARWGDDDGLTRALNGADLLVNLAGRSVNCRYNAGNRAQILGSRVSTTAELGRAVGRCSAPPSTWLNASTGTIYRHAEDAPQSEQDGELGEGFSVDVAKAWESALAGSETPLTRRIPLRISIVLGPGGGVMRPLANLARLGLGGPMGSGRQKFSWVHVEDLYRSVLFVHQRADITGPVNVASPDVVDNQEMMQLVRRAYGVPLGLPTPAWLLELGAVLIRTETELVLKSRWVQPRKLLDAGFIFRHPELGSALQDITGRRA
jgi:uncharacterized protein (TIGR01777 family)